MRWCGIFTCYVRSAGTEKTGEGHPVGTADGLLEWMGHSTVRDVSLVIGSSGVCAEWFQEPLSGGTPRQGYKNGSSVRTRLDLRLHSLSVSEGMRGVAQYSCLTSTHRCAFPNTPKFNQVKGVWKCTAGL